MGSIELSAVELIEKKRDGHALSRDEIRAFVQGFDGGRIPDYQASAWLMAVYIRGMTEAETGHLRQAITESGATFDCSFQTRPVVDKHSTGGVGDKVSLALAPLAASLGLCVPMMSGRGLGHTGGTLDKLESIPGFRTELSMEEIRKQLSEIGVVIISPIPAICPVDKKLYALRDVTATTSSLPLIVASIMSKKIAEGTDALLLDVKTGNGAFLADWDDSVALARCMVSTGEAAGTRTVALLTDMSQPLGRAVGNWLEMREAIEVLGGQGPPDVVALVEAQCAEMLVLGGLAPDRAAGLAQARENRRNGKGLETLRRLVESQGGDPCYVAGANGDAPASLPPSAFSLPVIATQSGWVSAMDTTQCGKASIALGAGRQQLTDVIDHKAGILLHKRVRLNPLIPKP
ncbi:pyrimidine-nucleoside phosphorylase [Baffinella frigidus]|nr:pyrimidine-nucleoside phosphorylase [Cryptophyta sp. CCMP2293]